ncbi:zf-HC2 domain-containing protein [Undibacterium sp. CY18W]|uniref:Zf-HC2 domain-containing protein n=1 Tax=Undibacterium hunanense TaxID=2762292 RepID=A0ABR6ZQK6_9BURK|nr:zf-HC2 domain-containing protein [Undibacterium hunanense]MBC3918162.1 zf-HC2 domain-containing protein [Undibacterium hunanense]
MNMKTSQPYPSDEAMHAIVQDLLPWYVVNTLQPDEKQLVQKHLQTCTACKDDLQWQIKLQAQEPAASTAPDPDRALARLLPKLDTPRLDTQSKQIQAARGKEKNSLLERLRTLLPASGTRSMGWIMAAQTAIIVGLVVHLALPTQDNSSYHVLGSGERSSGNIVVVFKPETTVKDIQRIMSLNDARIIDGPTVTNAYLLNVPDDRLTQSVDELRSEAVIELVESLQAGGAK